MDERERRRAYRHNAVLIDSDRVLTPQFDDAVVYLTGSQLELLRNVSQYLNRRETYRAEKHPGYYLMPDDSDYDDILAIVADMEESLMGNPNTIWGYKDRLEERLVTTSVGDPETAVQTVAVPAGYVHVIQLIHCHHTHGASRGVVLEFGLGGADPILYRAPAVPHNDVIVLPYTITLKEDDYLVFTVTALAVDKYAILRVLGYTMVVPE